jgi:ribosomal protein S18 acetylase RimI-like enzyme
VPAVRLGPLGRGHRAALETIVASTGAFRPGEVDVALEVFDAAMAPGQVDYWLVGAFGGDDALVGYACFGPSPGTVGTWELYWIAVAPAVQCQGVGSLLWHAVEHELSRRRARLCVLETSGHESYQQARGFYRRHGFMLTARVPNFYDDGDDRLTYVKAFGSASASSETP